MLRTSYIHPAPNNTCTPTPATQELHFAQASKRVAGALAIATALTGARCAALHPVHAASFVPGCSLCACACACCLCLCLCLYIMHTSVYIFVCAFSLISPTCLTQQTECVSQSGM